MATAKNILVLTYWAFEDALIQAYTLPYVKIMARNLPPGSRIFLVTLDKSPRPEVDQLAAWGIEHISFQYRPFGLRAVFMWLKVIRQLAKLIRREKVDVVHAWCTPAGGMGYVLSMLTGRPLVLDSFEPHAEPMVEGGTWHRWSPAFLILFSLEWLQLKRASTVIYAVGAMHAYARQRYGISKDHHFAKPACVDLELFSWRNRKRPDLVAQYRLNDTVSCVYAGKFGGLYLEQEVFDFFHEAYRFWGERFRVVLLSSITQAELERRAAGSAVPADIFIKQFVGHADVPDHMGVADFAICPMKPLPSRRYGTPIKNGEYWALGLPVVITPGISDDSGIIADTGTGSVIQALEPHAYRRSVQEIDALLRSGSPRQIYDRVRPIAEKHRNFKIAEEVYRSVYGTDATTDSVRR